MVPLFIGVLHEDIAQGFHGIAAKSAAPREAGRYIFNQLQ